MNKKVEILTNKAQSAIGAYSQGIRVGDFVFISGQIPLDPKTMKVIDGDIDDQIQQVLLNIAEVSKASGLTVNNIVKINVYLTDLKNFGNVNEKMKLFFEKPYPARAAVEVSRLPKDVSIEMDTILYGKN